jgi:hypothetical protein
MYGRRVSLNIFPGTPEAEFVVLCYTSLFHSWMKQIHYFTFWDYASLVASGISVPIAMLILGIAVSWSIDGFRVR